MRLGPEIRRHLGRARRSASRPSRSAWPRARRRGDESWSSSRAMGHTTDELTSSRGGDGAGAPQDEHPREMDMLLTRGERIAAALLDHGHPRAGVRGALLHREPGGDHHRHRPHRGPHPRGARRTGCGRRWRRGASPSWPASRACARRSEITTLGRGGSRHDGGGAGRGAGGRPLRDLHRRGRRLHGRPAARPRRAGRPRASRTRRCWRWRPSGAQVMHGRAVDIGARFGVDIRVLCSFVDDDGDDPRARHPDHPTGTGRWKSWW